MKINIFGSTGTIGVKSLKLLEKIPNIKINLLCSGSNYKLLIKQIIFYKPKYIYLNNSDKVKYLKKYINKETKILNNNELKSYLNSSRSDLTILSISGYKALYYIEPIINNTKNLGLVSKEVVVSAGHIFKKKSFKNKTNIFPLDSEHFSLFEFFNKTNTKKINIKKIFITASGGPFYKSNFKDLSKISFTQAIKHPKWKMGYKNSIDSATLVNKCLEVIETHYLFNIQYDKIDILIHPEALVHSIIEFNNYVVNMNLFKNDMSIPLINFLSLSKKNFDFSRINNNLCINNYNNFNFQIVENQKFPIYKFFKKLDKQKPQNLIKFNVGNEFAVELFKKKLIKYTDIYRIINKVCSLNLYYPLKNIKDIINYHEEIEKKISEIFKY